MNRKAVDPRCNGFWVRNSHTRRTRSSSDVEQQIIIDSRIRFPNQRDGGSDNFLGTNRFFHIDTNKRMALPKLTNSLFVRLTRNTCSPQIVYRSIGSHPCVPRKGWIRYSSQGKAARRRTEEEIGREAPFSRLWFSMGPSWFCGAHCAACMYLHASPVMPSEVTHIWRLGRDQWRCTESEKCGEALLDTTC